MGIRNIWCSMLRCLACCSALHISTGYICLEGAPKDILSGVNFPRARVAIRCRDVLDVGVELGGNSVASVTGLNGVVVAVTRGAFWAHGQVLAWVDFPRAGVSMADRNMSKISVELGGNLVAGVTGLHQVFGAVGKGCRGEGSSTAVVVDGGVGEVFHTPVTGAARAIRESLEWWSAFVEAAPRVGVKGLAVSTAANNGAVTNGGGGADEGDEDAGGLHFTS